MNQGLTGLDFVNFGELLTKANDKQLKYMLEGLNMQIEKREARQ